MDPLALRETLAGFPSGVAVVTAIGEDGRPAGLTLSAFCSVSADPALVLVCVDRGSNTLAAIQQAGYFTVNILAVGSEELAMRFSSKDGDKFAGVPWKAVKGIDRGGPILEEQTSAHLVCDTYQAIEAGDHWVFVGEVLEVAHDLTRDPLVFHRRTFSSVAPAGNAA